MTQREHKAKFSLTEAKLLTVSFTTPEQPGGMSVPGIKASDRIVAQWQGDHLVVAGTGAINARISGDDEVEWNAPGAVPIHLLLMRTE